MLPCFHRNRGNESRLSQRNKNEAGTSAVPHHFLLNRLPSGSIALWRFSAITRHSCSAISERSHVERYNSRYCLVIIPRYRQRISIGDTRGNLCGRVICVPERIQWRIRLLALQEQVAVRRAFTADSRLKWGVSMKKGKQLVFTGLLLVASLLAILGLGLRILLPYFVLIAAALCIPALIVGINILIERYFGDPPDNSPK